VTRVGASGRHDSRGDPFGRRTLGFWFFEDAGLESSFALADCHFSEHFFLWNEIIGVGAGGLRWLPSLKA